MKIGGAALDDPYQTRDFARAVAELASGGHRILVVHGGGTALTRTLAALGHESRFVGGLRVTDARMRDVAVMVLAGQVNKALVAAIVREGGAALGLCGGDLGLVRAVRKPAESGLGFVGEVSAVAWEWVEALWSRGAVPVVASIGLGDDGEFYNINADEVASACASAGETDALVFLTDVPGVRGTDGAVMPRLPASAIPSLVADSVVGGGMLPKLEACARALRAGVGRVRILPAVHAGLLPDFLTGQPDHGTEVVAC